MKFHRYSGAGNSFMVADARGLADNLVIDIPGICSENRTDGLMLLREGDGKGLDFRMEYFNSDGSGGMMCGNGGRCIVAFADALGIKPSNGEYFVFTAADGLHTASVLSRSENGRKIVRLQMIDVHEFHPALDGWFLNTGTRHFVKWVDDAEALDIQKEGPRYRHDPSFAPIGVNANFVQSIAEGELKVRTFEKGVEDETLACGTGITACAIAAFLNGEKGTLAEDGSICYSIHARIDDLSVDFVPGDGHFTAVHLTGPAEEIL